MQEVAAPSLLASAAPLTLLVSMTQSLVCKEVLYAPLLISGSLFGFDCLCSCAT